MTHGQGHKANDVFAPRGAWQSRVSADFFALGYDPFGSLLPGRNYSSSSYNYGFNGMRKDDEIHGATGTSYDFGARLYDPRVGRWLSLDPLAAKFPSEAPYLFAGDNPIWFVDVGGKYKYPTQLAAQYTKKYPLLTKYLSTQVQKDVMGSTTIKQGLFEFSGGNLTEGEVSRATQWGSGPNIRIVDKPGGVLAAMGHYDPVSNTISLNQDLATFFEQASDEERAAALTAVFGTLMHETVHYGDWLDRSPQEGELGVDFVEKVFTKDILLDAHIAVPLMDGSGDVNRSKTLDNARKVMDVKQQVDPDVIPTVPDEH